MGPVSRRRDRAGQAYDGLDRLRAGPRPTISAQVHSSAAADDLAETQGTYSVCKAEAVLIRAA